MILLLAGSSTLVPAQTRKLSPKQPLPSARKLISIKVTGTKRYTPDEIIAASGLQLGQTAGEEDFQRTGQRLGETGAFSDVLYSYQYSSQGTELELQLSDGDQFVPARFENFVWLSDQELMEKLHARVPLFDGQVPLSGNLADQVSDALQALLIERNVPGHADYLRFAHGDGPIEAFVFSVAGPNIRIRNVGFTGAAPSELPLLQTTAKGLPGQDYLRSLLRIRAEKDFLPVYLERGYLKAVFADAQAKVVAQNPQETLVDVTLPVDPGGRYKLGEIQWSGNTVFPANQLQSLIHLRAGEPANAIQLGKDIEAVNKLYGARGYMTAGVQPVPQMDDAQSAVSYQLQVHEGDIYRMGELEVQGLDAKGTALLVSNWKLRAGEAYDSSYLKRFLEEAAREFANLDRWNASTHETLNQKDKTVDVTLRFDPKPPR